MEKNYVKFQPNPSGNTMVKDDSAVRALCAATGKTWIEAYDLLCECGKEVFSMPTTDLAMERVMYKLGFKKVKVTDFSNLLTPSTLTMENKNKCFVMSLNRIGLFVGGRDGNYMTTSNGGVEGKQIYFYYEKENGNE